MVFILFAMGLALIAAGLWGGPVPNGRRPGSERADLPADPGAPLSAEEAWERLSSPVDRQEEMIPIPEHRPWYLPGRDRRFLQGLLVGVGSGLFVSAMLMTMAPRPAPVPPVVPPPVGPPPTAQSPGRLPAPAPAAPAPAAPAAPPPQAKAAVPKPETITFVVEPGDMPPAVATRLRDQGLIADEDAFLERLEGLGLDTRLKAGTFTLRTGAPLDEVILSLTA